MPSPRFSRTDRLWLGPLLALCTASPLAAQLTAFPGAQGYGALATGGRGGDVYHVTNLNSSGAGSLAEGIASAPTSGRTIVFDVSGYIHVPGSNLRMTKNKVTIAGQTAPGDGIGLKDGTFRISADDVVIRHLRFRHGKNGSGGDCIDLDSNSSRSILDHISMQFSTDENMSSFGSPPEDLTLQWALNAWGLESHSCGGLWDQSHATAHHTLWAHNHTRNPKARPGTLDWINNVTFDWDIGFIMGDSETPASWKANVRNSYFLSPPGNLRSKALEKANLDRNGVPNFTLFLDGCLHDADGDGVLNGTNKGYGIASGSYNTAAAAFPSSTVPVTMDDALTAYKKVVSQSGALRMAVDPEKPLRDEVDTILLQKLTTQKHFHVTRESDTGASAAGFGVLASTAAPQDTDRDGMPDFWEQAVGFNAGIDDHNTVFASSGGVITANTFFPAATPAGYTYLEEYLHYLAIPHGTVAKNTAGGATSLAIDLRKFSSGFSKNPVFSVSGVANGTTTVSGPGNALVTFVPTLNFSGRALFNFTVTDDDGSTWIQTCAILVSNSALPRDLKWKGDGSANLWDTSVPNFLNGAVPVSFGNGDRVLLDDTGSATPSLAVPGSISPGAMDVSAAASYTLTGAGAIGSTGPLVKRGTGTLAISNTGPNSFTSVSVEDGTLALNNAGAIGAAPIRMTGGALTLNPANNSGFANTLELAAPTVIQVNSQHALNGAWTGSGPLTLGGNSLWTLGGSWTGYTGRITYAPGNSPRLRMYGSLGSPAVALDLGNAGGQLMNRNGAATFDLGSLTGGSGTQLNGAQSVNAASTYSIGALGTDDTFAGSILNGSMTGSPATNIIKTGTGTWTLSGTSSHTGTTAVNNGTLSVTGTLGNTAITVLGGATLAGNGTLGGPVTLTSGGYLSPGTAALPAAPLQIAGGLTLPAGSILPFDLSATPGGTNDRIAMQGGTLTLGGAINFRFRLTDGLLGPGVYPLIEGAVNSTASGVNLTHDLPATGTRQTFALGRSAAGGNPSSVWLTVTGTAASLAWKGNLDGAWDLNSTSNWQNGAGGSTYYNFDAVSFGDSATTGNVVLSAPLAPRSLLVDNSSLAYTFSGQAITGTGKLTKRGGGLLTLAPATGIVNTWSGGTDIEGGTIQLANDDANASGLGPGDITFKGGTLSMYRNSATYNSATYRLIVPGGQTGVFNADDRCDLYGSLSGGGTLDFRIPWVRTTYFGDPSSFTGRIRIVDSTNNGGDFRIGTSYGFPGFPAAAVELTSGSTFSYVGTLSGGDGTTVAIGELSGAANAVLFGGATGGRFLTYRIGGKNTDATFAGSITDQNAYCPTTVVKTGGGIWTLSGASTYGGRTVVEQGTLKVSGSITNLNALDVAAGAALQLEGGTLALDSVNAGAGTGFSGYGTVGGDLNGGGLLSLRGYASGTGGLLYVGGNLTLPEGSTLQARIGTTPDSLSIAGDFTFSGTLQLSVPAGTAGGRYPFATVAGATQIGTVILLGAPAGMTAVLDTSTAGQVAVVLVGPYEQWRFARFNSYSSAISAPTADADGDGQSNEVEFLAGTSPTDGGSTFRANATKVAGGYSVTWASVIGRRYQVQSSITLDGNWAPIHEIVATGLSTSFTDSTTSTAKFYRVKILP